MTRNTLTLVLAIVAAAHAPGAVAERADREKEIVVVADKSLLDDKSRTVVFEGNVVVTQGTMRITATRVTLKEDADKHQFYVANGAPVTFRQKRDKVDEYIDGMAERAEFDDRNDVLRLYSRARVKVIILPPKKAEGERKSPPLELRPDAGTPR